VNHQVDAHASIIPEWSAWFHPQLLNCARLDRQDPLKKTLTRFHMIMRGSWCCAKGRGLNPWTGSHPPNLPLAAALESEHFFKKIIFSLKSGLVAASEHAVGFCFIYKVSGAGALQGVTQEPSALT
jgi:hypothetical protein